MHTYKETFLTRRHELDMDHLLRVQCICNYMEEAAGAHADALGVGISRLLQDHLTWALAKMRLNLHRRPGPGENISVVTWPVGLDRAQFRRDFILYDSRDTILADAVTQWVVMGTQSRRLERFPFYIAELQPKDPPLAQESGDIRIPATGDSCPVRLSFPVRLADIDQNRHVNNGRYIDFSLEAADCAGASGELCRIDIIFRAEALRGDVIAVRTAPEEESSGSFIHGLFRESDGRELARARTVFLR
jgi:acyl-ACP thioesterase